MGRLRVAAKIAAEPGATVWVAVRPEKMRMRRTAAAPDPQSALPDDVAATVVDVGYLGDMSIYRLRTDAGVLVQGVQRQYRAARGDAAAAATIDDG